MNGFMSVVLFYMMLIQSSQGFTAEKGNEIDPLYFGGSFILRNFMGPRITQKTYTGQEGGPFSPDNRYQMTFGPSLYLQFESDKKVINLTPNNFTTVTEKIIDFSEEDTENRPVIQFQSQSNHGQYVYRKTALHLGVGMRAGIAYMLDLGKNNLFGILGGSAFFASVGLVPLYGRSVIMEQTIDDSSQLVPMEKLLLKSWKGEVESWNSGDRLTYTSRGGVVFVGQVGVSVVSLGVNYIAQGEWETQISKGEGHTVQVQLSQSDLQSVGLIANGTVGKVSLSSFHDIDRGLSFVFDLDNPVAKEAYQNMIVGNARLAQELINDKNSGVRPIEKFQGEADGHFFGARFDIPLLRFELKKSEINSFRNTLNYPNGTSYDVHYGSYLKENNAIIVQHNRKTRLGFTSSHSQLVNERSVVAPLSQAHFSGEMNWTYEDNNMATFNMKKKIVELSQLTGLNDLLKVNFSHNYVKMGYARISFRLRIPQKATEELMEMATNENTFVDFRSLPKKLAQAYFAKGDDFDLCEKTILIFESCSQKMLSETSRSASLMIKSLKKMKVALDAGRAKEFSSAYAKFGKAMTKNLFTFQSIFQLMKGQGIVAEYKVEGEKIARFRKSFEWLPLVEPLAVE